MKKESTGKKINLVIIELGWINLHKDNYIIRAPKVGEVGHDKSKTINEQRNDMPYFR